MFLIINTVEEDKFTVALADAQGDFIKKVTKRGKFIEAEKILPAIDKLIKPKYKYQQLKGIIVARGPGGFTSVRIGVITANTFSYALNIPVVGLKRNEYRSSKTLGNQGVKKLKKAKKIDIVTPFYGREPNITKPKKSNY